MKRSSPRLVWNVEKEKIVIIDYTNWRGERGERRIRPIAVAFLANEWHPEPQWLLTAIDVDKDARRDFAMAGIHSWRKSTR